MHIVKDAKINGYGIIAYPGPLFPNSFSELEKLERGGFYIVEDNKLRWEPIQIYNIFKIAKNCNGLAPVQIFDEIMNVDNEREELLIKNLMDALSAEKQEGETNPDFERRIKEEVSRVLDVD